jgi:hypothetical protein
MITANDELERKWKEANIACFKLLSSVCIQWLKQTTKTTSGLRIKPWTQWIQSRNTIQTNTIISDFSTVILESDFLHVGPVKSWCHWHHLFYDARHELETWVGSLHESSNMYVVCVCVCVCVCARVCMYVYFLSQPLEHKATNGFLISLQHTLWLLGQVISSSQGLYLHKTTQHRETKDKHACPEQDLNPWSTIQVLKAHASDHAATWSTVQ